jgi:tRNA G18 (ribose-2'-O)-methylase SpoU
MTERVTGRIPVLECLRAGKRPARRLFVLDGAKGLDELLDAAAGVETDYCSRRELDAKVPGDVHQGVVLEAAPLPLLDEGDWLKQLDGRKDAVAVLLDGIEDPHNFGAIVRSAAALGAAGVVFAKDRSAPISPASLKAAAGAMEYIDLVRVTNLARAIESMQAAGFWIAALTADADQNLWEREPHRPQRTCHRQRRQRRETTRIREMRPTLAHSHRRADHIVKRIGQRGNRIGGVSAAAGGESVSLGFANGQSSNPVACLFNADNHTFPHLS